MGTLGSRPLNPSRTLLGIATVASCPFVEDTRSAGGSPPCPDRAVALKACVVRLRLGLLSCNGSPPGVAAVVSLARELCRRAEVCGSKPSSDPPPIAPPPPATLPVPSPWAPSREEMYDVTPWASAGVSSAMVSRMASSSVAAVAASAEVKPVGEGLPFTASLPEPPPLPPPTSSLSRSSSGRSGTGGGEAGGRKGGGGVGIGGIEGGNAGGGEGEGDGGCEGGCGGGRGVLPGG